MADPGREEKHQPCRKQYSFHRVLRGKRIFYHIGRRVGHFRARKAKAKPFGNPLSALPGSSDRISTKIRLKNPRPHLILLFSNGTCHELVQEPPRPLAPYSSAPNGSRVPAVHRRVATGLTRRPTPPAWVPRVSFRSDSQLAIHVGISFV